MEKLEKVIAGLECYQSDDKDCDKSCPYFSGYDLSDCLSGLLNDTLVVLKEDRSSRNGCPKCSPEYNQKFVALHVRYHSSTSSTSTSVDVEYCPCCGRKLVD